MFSTGIKWSEFDNEMRKQGKEVLTVAASGYCFIESVRLCLERDLDVSYMNQQIVEKILDEVYEQGTFYKMFHTGSIRKLIEETQEYLKERKFTNDVIDVIVVAATNALKINLKIFQRHMDMLQIVEKPCVTVASNRDVYLKYECMGGSYHGLDHYNAVVKVKPSPPAITPSIPSTSNTNTNPTNIDSSSSSDDEGDTSKTYDIDNNSFKFIADEVDSAFKHSEKLYDSLGVAIENLSDFDDGDGDVDDYQIYRSEKQVDHRTDKNSDKVGEGKRFCRITRKQQCKS